MGSLESPESQVWSPQLHTSPGWTGASAVGAQKYPKSNAAVPRTDPVPQLSTPKTCLERSCPLGVLTHIRPQGHSLIGQALVIISKSS